MLFMQRQEKLQASLLSAAIMRDLVDYNRVTTPDPRAQRQLMSPRLLKLLLNYDQNTPPLRLSEPLKPGSSIKDKDINAKQPTSLNP
jgi:hypothetical protein